MTNTLRYFRYAFLLLALTLVSCVREEIAEPDNGPADGKLLISGSLDLPEGETGWVTKSFGEVGEVTIAKLYVAVFDDSDILREVATARPGPSEADTDPAFTYDPGVSGYPFHVQLTGEAQRDCYIQFIALSAADEGLDRAVNGDFAPVDEASFVHDLVTDNTNVAYWGRMYVNTITRNTHFSNIRMIRNFAKVLVRLPDGGISNFTLLGFKVFDAPSKGTVAPFNNNADDYSITNDLIRIKYDRFADYASASGQANPYTWLTESKGYHGYMPADFEYNALESYYNESSDTMDGLWVSPSGADYLYECSYRPKRNPFIIMKAQYGTGANPPTYYYKADFVFNNEEYGITEYYDILRNFQYVFTISTVTGPGKNTVYEAVHSIALNNFQGSTLAQELTNISSGDSHLFVSTTDALITGGTEFVFYYKNLDGSTPDNGSVTIKPRDPSDGNWVVKRNSVVVEEVETLQPDIVIAPADETSATWDDWRKVTVRLTDLSSLKKGDVYKQDIVIKNNDGLSRVLTLTLRHPFALNVDADDIVAKTEDSDVTVRFSIPSGLTEHRFPLVFYVEQENNTLYPKALPAADKDKALVAAYGYSRIPGNTSNRGYYFRRTVTWNEYNRAASDSQGNKTFECQFRTLQANSATTVWVFPTEDAPYFVVFDDVENDYINKDSFTNDMVTPEVKFPFKGLQLSVGGSATVKATSTSTGAITYSVAPSGVVTVNPSTGLVTAVAAGNATVTATVAATGAFASASDSYTVNVTSGTLSELSVQWDYEPPHVIRIGQTVQGPLAVASTKGGYSGTVTFNYATTSSDGGAISVLNESTADADGYVQLRGTTAGTVHVTATASASGGDCAATSQSISYDIQVVAEHPEPGTVYHSETFLGPTLGDYTFTETVTVQGVDRHEDFDTYTTYNAGNSYDPRGVWYAYYNKQQNSGNGAAASAYGAVEAPTRRWNPDVSVNVTDYHNKSLTSHAQLISKEIDLSSSAGATLIFEHTGEYFYNTVTFSDMQEAGTHMRNDVKVMISKDGGANWTDATIKHYPDGYNWVFVRTSVDIPADYLTDRFRLLFDYTSIGGNEVQKEDAEGHPLYYAVDNGGEGGSERILTTETTENTGYPIMVIDKENPGRAGTWEIRNVEIKERTQY